MKRLITGLFGVGLFVAAALAEQPDESNLKLHALFSDNMVLQRDREIRVWGTASPGQTIKVRIGERRQSTTVAEDGRWEALLRPMDAGGPHELSVEGAQTVVLTNVLIGDVWICSGQSNMQWPVVGANDAEQEVAAAQHPRIRLLTVPNVTASAPLNSVNGQWDVCSPRTIPDFSAVGYFFGRGLHERLDIPIGLIDSSWGGTLAEAWTPHATLTADEELVPILDGFEATMELYPSAMKKYKEDLESWNRSKAEGTAKPEQQTDPGNKGFELGWAGQEADASEWKAVAVPCSIESITNIDGAVWFRREVEIPESWAGKSAMLSLGPVDDFDETYFNGTKVGATGKETPGFWAHPRRYEASGELVRPGRAVIAVRVFDHFMGGGFPGAPDAMNLTVSDTGESIPLAGEWKYRIEVALDPQALASGEPRRPMGPDSCNAPSRLYNAMIHPLTPFGIRGAIWYQGEANTHSAEQYKTLLPAMIASWREAWGWSFPFMIVQLANFMPTSDVPSESSWSEIREVQASTAHSDPLGGLAVTIDVGEADDIHPRDKQTVGKRLALAARGIAYGEGIVYSGPVYESMKVKGSEIVLEFKHIGSGLVAKGGKLKQFAVAGEDRRFVWAEARIEGDAVVVRSNRIPAPVAVRYAWGNNPEGCNLLNREGLPAVPFRTDNWAGLTIKGD